MLCRPSSWATMSHVKKIAIAVACTLVVIAHIVMMALGAGDLLGHYWLAADAPGDHIHATLDVLIMLSVALPFSLVALAGLLASGRAVPHRPD